MLYHTGGTQLVYQGLNTWVHQIAKCANQLRNDDLHERALTVLSMGYQGVTLNHQERPVEAITCFHRALETIKHLGYTKLEGYIYQGLSEAQAKAQQRQESHRSIGLAEKNFELQSLSLENNLTKYNLSSLTAQKGVNAVFLHDYKEAINQIDNSFTQYNPTHMRGRARLLLQKAEAIMEWELSMLLFVTHKMLFCLQAPLALVR